MKNYPISKYQFSRNEKEITATSTFAGKEVTGKAKLDPRDEFDVEYGCLLAASRCNEKVAYKRYMRAKNKVESAIAKVSEANEYLQRMTEYLNDANKAYNKSRFEVQRIIKNPPSRD